MSIATAVQGLRARIDARTRRERLLLLGRARARRGLLAAGSSPCARRRHGQWAPRGGPHRGGTRGDARAAAERPGAGRAARARPVATNWRRRPTCARVLPRCDEALTERTARVISPGQMVAVLRDVVSADDALTLVALRNTGVEPVIEEARGDDGAAADVPRVYRHRVELVVAGGYFDLLGYLERLEGLRWQFQWDALELETTDYPRARATVSLSTLSLAEDWIGVEDAVGNTHRRPSCGCCRGTRAGGAVAAAEGELRDPLRPPGWGRSEQSEPRFDASAWQVAYTLVSGDGAWPSSTGATCAPAIPSAAPGSSRSRPGALRSTIAAIALPFAVRRRPCGIASAAEQPANDAVDPMPRPPRGPARGAPARRLRQHRPPGRARARAGHAGSHPRGARRGQAQQRRRRDPGRRAGGADAGGREQPAERARRAARVDSFAVDQGAGARVLHWRWSRRRRTAWLRSAPLGRSGGTGARPGARGRDRGLDERHGDRAPRRRPRVRAPRQERLHRRCPRACSSRIEELVSMPTTSMLFDRRGDPRTCASARARSPRRLVAATAATAMAGSAGRAQADPEQTSRTESQAQISGSDLQSTVSAIVGGGEGRSVVVDPQAGLVVVRAMPGELRDVGQYLSAAQQNLQRQVILEAKILEVRLSEQHEAGVNWAALAQGSNTAADAAIVGQAQVTGGETEVLTEGGAFDPTSITRPGGVNGLDFGGLFAIGARTTDFAALIRLLDTQGDVQVLSSPRVSTVNNQKAVIKVGSDEFFVTDVESDQDTSATSTTRSVDVELTPFFSGIALDVTPQIGRDGDVTLHVHPTVSEVTDQTKSFTVAGQTQTLPLAFSQVRESDSVVRARDGQVIVIGGLMQDQSSQQRAQAGGLGDLPLVGALFRQKADSSRRRPSW
ncbi:MAG: pilus (MSHA type) biogenesis protein MshL [Halofilum sp. (in: g-proteobacteria)]|nr:pilus (MSHA type) biogenesis protein MshL [Halofilum sp. (in: g-proteobacteria)]